jgi:ketosteroid isomerase-like protein
MTGVGDPDVVMRCMMSLGQIDTGAALARERERRRIGGISMKLATIALAICFLGTAVLAAGAEEPKDFQAAMEANNAEWLQAYNTQDVETLADMYAEDAILIAAGTQPIQGAKDIEAYWAEDVRGYGDHTWTILETRGASDLAYQVAEWTVAERGTGTQYSGNTVRILERQPNGEWLTKVHMFSVHE